MVLVVAATAATLIFFSLSLRVLIINNYTLNELLLLTYSLSISLHLPEMHTYSVIYTLTRLQSTKSY